MLFYCLNTLDIVPSIWTNQKVVMDTIYAIKLTILYQVCYGILNESKHFNG